MNSSTHHHKDLAKDIEYFKLRYGCYFKVLDVSAESLKMLSENENFNLCFEIIWIVFGIINISVNSLLIHGLFKTHRRLSFVQKLFVYLSSMDLLAGIVLMPTLIYYQMVGLTCLYMTFMMCGVMFVACGDATIVLIISILRFQAIRDPFQRGISSKKKYLLIITQLLFIMIGPIAFYWTYYVKGTIEDFQFIGYLSNGLMSSLTLAILLCVLFTLLEIRRHNKDSKIIHESMLKSHKKSAKSLLIIGCLMLFFMAIQIPNFYTLHVLLRGAGVLSGKTFRTTKRMVDVTVILNLLNTSMNSIVILSRSKKMKSYYRNTFRKSFTFYQSESDV